LKELEFIKYIKGKFRYRKPVVKGIGDDCAVVSRGKGTYGLFTADMLIEGIHFKKNTPPFFIGRKAMCVNISDIAAMGAKPEYALISVGASRKKGISYLKGISDGALAAAKKFNVSVIGGDTNASPVTVINVMMTGSVEKKNLITRSGARKGDCLFVTGVLGEGNKRHLTFTPRLREAGILARNFRISAMIDLSDGLSMDLNRLASESRVGARVYRSLIPVREYSERSIENAIYAGEDFELLFAASPRESRKIIKSISGKNGLNASLIGEVTGKSGGVRLVKEDGSSEELKPRGYSHF